MTQRQRVKKHHPVKHHVIAEIKPPIAEALPLSIPIEAEHIAPLADESGDVHDTVIIVAVPKSAWQKFLDFWK